MVCLWTNAVCGLWSLWAGGLPQAGGRLSKPQRAMVQRVEGAVAEFVSEPPPVATGKRATVSATTSRLASSARGYGLGSGPAGPGCPVGPEALFAAESEARWGQADLLALPEVGGTVNMIDHLPAATAET